MTSRVLSHYALDGSVISCERYGCGHINETYLVHTASGKRYILQKINHHIFKDVPGLMENIAADLGVEPDQVNVKATTEEGLGFTGAMEGMAAHAVCLLFTK